MSETTNKPIEPTQLEKALKAVSDGHMTAYKACKLYQYLLFNKNKFFKT